MACFAVLVKFWVWVVLCKSVERIVESEKEKKEGFAFVVKKKERNNGVAFGKGEMADFYYDKESFEKVIED